MERRVLNSVEVRASQSGKEMRISGYAARYNTLSSLLPAGKQSFRERIAKRSFDRVLSTKPDVVALLNHDPNKILGRTSSGTLQLRSDDKGLAFDCLLPDTMAGRDTHESIKRGDLNACSFAFGLDAGMDEFAIEEDSEDRSKRMIVRTIRDFRSLMDVSVVAYPAYSNTSVGARSMDIVAAEVRSRFEAFTNPRISERSLRIQAECKRYGLPADTCLEDLVEAERIVARRRALNNFILS